MKYSKEKNNGITLIALVVTIIVLLILAGVSISMLTGNNGIITQAQKAKRETEESQEKENLEIAVASSKIKNTDTLEIKRENLENAIKEQFGNNKDFSIEDNGDGSFLVSMNDTNRIYYVDETGKIISNNKMLKISTIDEFKKFRDNVNEGNNYQGWYIYLVNNININENWTPIGKYISEDSIDNIPFKGIFDGRNYTIEGIQINYNSTGVGLFAYADNATIKNLKTGKNSSITGYKAVGGIVGKAVNQTTISNCENQAILQINSSGDGLVGGIAGTVRNTTIYNCSNIVTIGIDSGNLVGGILGSGTEANILKCYNTGNIKGTFNIGGIIGSGDGSVVNSCYNTGNIHSSDNAAGIAGQMFNSGIVKNCYNIGNVETTNLYNRHVGAMVGVFNDTQTINTYYLENTINNGDNIDNNSIEFTLDDVEDLYLKLGNDFKEDYEGNKINNGYPILSWQ